MNEDTCNLIYDFIETGLAQSNSVLVHGIHNQSTSYLVITIYLMMKFRWDFEQTFEYMLTKQPNFYLVPQFVEIVRVLEQFLLLKYQQLAAVENKDEVLIWNTFINTRIAPSGEASEQTKQKSKATGSVTCRVEEQNALLESNVGYLLQPCATLAY